MNDSKEKKIQFRVKSLSMESRLHAFFPSPRHRSVTELHRNSISNRIHGEAGRHSLPFASPNAG